MVPRLILAMMMAGPVWADGCPTAPDHGTVMDRLYGEIGAAPNEAVARPLVRELWALWTQAPDGPSQAMLDSAMQAIRVGDYAGAAERLDALVSYCPFYAEGYNQRGFVHYLTGAFDAALPDLDQAIALNPRHTGALTGKALTLVALGQRDAAQKPLRTALALNPWLSERVLLSAPEDRPRD
ncbi:tetratricopeptide repeat protein [Marivita sp. GX14005]|uniref:tetratricopeptide repeat protein n=1 Tax=Marivita sp. GX14005 TaxID=2942276 RepID=UPI00201997C8|nr:tetratricopeptide repeat protein [Marivita sp. GX14005]MCL3881126.1 tetratricopeptide repeat protein [Marivita sp. GX14005]